MSQHSYTIVVHVNNSYHAFVPNIKYYVMFTETSEEHSESCHAFVMSHLRGHLTQNNSKV